MRSTAHQSFIATGRTVKQRVKEKDEKKGNKLCILMMICDHFDPSTTLNIEFFEAFRTCGKSTV